MYPGYVNSDPETTPSLPVSLANLITCWCLEKKKKNPTQTPKKPTARLKNHETKAVGQNARGSFNLFPA